MFSLVGTITIKASVNNDVQSVNNDVQVEAEDVPPYLNTSLSFEERAADLVSRMTL